MNRDEIKDAEQDEAERYWNHVTRDPDPNNPAQVVAMVGLRLAHKLTESLDRESRLERDKEELEVALKFYASRHGYRHGTISLGPPVHLDEGKIARKALKEVP